MLLHPTSLPGPYGIGDLGPEAHAFQRPGRGGWWEQTHGLHLTEPGSDLWRERLAFRDALRADAELAAEYERWKLAHASPPGAPGPYDEGKTAFVALGPANRVAVVHATTFEVEKYLLVGRRVWHLDLTPDGELLFTTNGLTNDVSVIDVASLEVLRSTPVGRQPWGVAI